MNDRTKTILMNIGLVLLGLLIALLLIKTFEGFLDVF